MDLSRTLRHLASTGWGLRNAFSASVLTAIEQAITEAERRHGGEIRFAIEDSLGAADLWRGKSPRDRAVEVFAQLGVWDTELNNGVLIYVLWADHDVEIVADRGFRSSVSQQDWHAVCQRMEVLFAQQQPQQAVVEGIVAISALIARQFPAVDRNELPNRPVML